MVMYVDVADAGEVKQLAVNDVLIGAFGGRIEDEYDGEEIWWIDDYNRLVEIVGEEIASQLHQMFLKYEHDAMWFPNK